MKVTDTKEKGLESLIVQWLVEENGYEQGSNADYIRDFAIDETRLFRFLQETQPEQLKKLGVNDSVLPHDHLVCPSHAKGGLFRLFRAGVFCAAVRVWRGRTARFRL